MALNAIQERQHEQSTKDAGFEDISELREHTLYPFGLIKPCPQTAQVTDAYYRQSQNQVSSKIRYSFWTAEYTPLESHKVNSNPNPAYNQDIKGRPKYVEKCCVSS